MLTSIAIVALDNPVASVVAELPFKGDLEIPSQSVARPIQTLDELEVQLKFYLSKGLGDERFVENKELFELLKSVAQKYATDIDLGGNASTMAWRAYLEGCKIKVGFPLNKKYFDKYFGSDDERVEVIGGLKEIVDYHLSLNYYLNSKILGITIPRSNRIFMNHDIDNGLMSSVDSALEHLDGVDIIAIGGTQLPSSLTIFVNKLEHIKAVLSQPENAGKEVHLESSAFSNITFYDRQLDILLPRVDLPD